MFGVGLIGHLGVASIGPPDPVPPSQDFLFMDLSDFFFMDNTDFLFMS